MGKILGIALIAVALFVVLTDAGKGEKKEKKEKTADDVKKYAVKKFKLDEKTMTGKDVCDAYKKGKEGKEEGSRKKRDSDDEEKEGKGKKGGKGKGKGEFWKKLQAEVAKACEDADVKPDTIFQKVAEFLNSSRKDKKSDNEE